MTTGRAFLKFCLVGIVNTAVNYGIFAGLLAWHLHYLTASSTGFLAGVITSYVINRRWTFAVQDQANWREASRFLLVNLVALGANVAVMAVSVEWCRLPARIAWGMAIIVSLNVNFFGSKCWAFRRA